MPLNVVLGAQWGDEGKGHVVDYLAESADVVARFAGGDNAGHTVAVDDKVFKLHIIPSGIVRDKICVLGNGMVINPRKLREEMQSLREAGLYVGPENLAISERAHIIQPFHINTDKQEEESKQKLDDKSFIGTTQRGIGPAYTDKISRCGYHIEGYGDEFGEYTTDTSEFLNEWLEDGSSILVEGAQGMMLDIDHGDYPYVTSSNPTIGGVFTGLGVSPKYLSQTWGVVKAFSTRIGTGPMPSEILFDEDIINHLRGDGTVLGDEYGTTTGRPRRMGWLDIPQLKYSCRINGYSHLAITKLDILSGLKQIPVYLGDKYTYLDGWQTEISEVNEFLELPLNAQRYVRFIQHALQVPVFLISVGPYRHQIFAV
jgi:adenylosuccinate synthase